MCCHPARGKSSRVLNSLQRERVFVFTHASWFPNFLIGLMWKHFTMRLYVVFSTQRRLVGKLSNSLITQSNSGAPKSLNQDFPHFTQTLQRQLKLRTVPLHTIQTYLKLSDFGFFVSGTLPTVFGPSGNTLCVRILQLSGFQEDS